MLAPTHPLRFFVSYNLRKTGRTLVDLSKGTKFSKKSSRSQKDFQLRIEHRSPILRKLKGVDPQLQINKKTNLKIVEKSFDGVVILPGETFSFWQIAGKPDQSRGFLPGLIIKGGEPSVGTGGGLCQLSNSLFWSFLHTSMTCIERHRHSFDLFPDSQRAVPSGLGAGVAYGIKDLRFKNSSKITYQLKVKIEEDDLIVQVFSSHSEPSIRIYQTDSMFYRKFDIQTNSAKVFRKNNIWRESNGKNTLIYANDFEVKYEVDPKLIR